MEHGAGGTRENFRTNGAYRFYFGTRLWRRKGTLAHEFPSGYPIVNYDPATFPEEPSSADFVACLDVLEHIEPALLPNVLTHLRSKTHKAGYHDHRNRPAEEVTPGWTQRPSIRRASRMVAPAITPIVPPTRGPPHRQPGRAPSVRGDLTSGRPTTGVPVSILPRITPQPQVGLWQRRWSTLG